MYEKDCYDEMAESLTGFWKFMLIFALLITGLVTYVNALGKLEQRNDTNVLTTAFIFAPPEEERILQIFAYTTENDRGRWMTGLRRLYDNTEVCATGMDATLEFYGEGIIELQYSDHVGRSITFGRPHDGEVADKITGLDGYAKRDDAMIAVIPANVQRNIDLGGEIVDWHFMGTREEFVDYNRVYNQYYGEANPEVSLQFWHCRRFVSETHLFVTMYSHWRQSEVIATATLRIRSHDRWRDAHARNELADQTNPYTLSNTTVEVIDYWQADDWTKE